MADAVEDRVRTIIAEELGAKPENVRPETARQLADCSDRWRSGGWRRLYNIADRIECAFGIRFDLGAADLWTTVADVIVAAETVIERDAALVAAASQRGRAA